MTPQWLFAVYLSSPLMRAGGLEEDPACSDETSAFSQTGAGDHDGLSGRGESMTPHRSLN
jgi:hypothetical protein